MEGVNIIRDVFSSRSTIGRLYIQDTLQCYTLEPPKADVDVKPRAIPVGMFQLTIRESPRFGRLMPHVEDVPDFAGILLHWGNYPSDTEGCALVGQTRGEWPDFIGSSKKAFTELFFKLQQICPTTITYSETKAMFST